jgi:hypothetical protein
MGSSHCCDVIGRHLLLFHNLFHHSLKYAFFLYSVVFTYTVNSLYGFSLLQHKEFFFHLDRYTKHEQATNTTVFLACIESIFETSLAAV